MSKKIIYLLSLLMALSLVFASCKKNNGLDPNNGGLEPPKEEDNTAGKIDAETGLVTDDQVSSLPADKPLKKVTIFKGDANNYLRNPVVVVMGTDRSTPVVFAEKRYNGPGAANDVGIDGKATVDVVYKVGAQSGQNFGAETIVSRGATGPNDSHGAPVVFKVGDNQVVVVASAGAGIARTEEAASAKAASKIEYAVGTLSGTTFTWDTPWTELKVNNQSLLDTIKTIKTGNNSDNFEQMGTQAARGYVGIDNKTLILPVVMAQQGTTSSVKELMGVYFVKGTVSGNTVNWQNLGTDARVVFTAKTDSNFSTHKESQVIAGTSDSDVKYVAVPSPWGSPVTDNYGLGTGKTDQPKATQIKGHDGAPGYLAFKWFGATSYQASTYKDQAADAGLFLGPKNNAANITLYLVNKDTLNKEGKADGFELNAIGKSGSIDVLGDGTVVTAAEEGNNGDRNYYTSFTRYSQSYLASILQ
ncbi:sialidase (neuraminidase) family protein-like protein [Brachyspira pilosicoli B2904]|uniref:Sialidase (Neuraminidase) family protein-like protein n=1 Tax=Brachyspira pilosicoli B2904 TaxID=1133568 RepID=J9UW59_BRAPL|nr:sialidase family protein [Brachyspira pilosicoli]AFR71143.1 sialidase (neuraminidase) family protein-like protein [Brachyspira pilosicoli B2904]